MTNEKKKTREEVLFKPGNVANPKGRGKGTLNKKTKEVITAVNKVINLIESKYLQKDLARIGPNARVKLWADLQEFKYPKLSRAEISQETVTKMELIVKRNIVDENPKQLGDGSTTNI